MEPVRKGVWIVIASLLSALLLAELGFRLLAARDRGAAWHLDGARTFYRDGVMSEYERNPYTIFQRTRSRDGFINGMNARGFNDWEWSLKKTPGVPRVLCLGASTTEGGNADGRKGAYPTQLERALEARTGRDFEVMNAGISGWSTAEGLMAWFLMLKDYQPDLVIIQFAVNDVNPRRRANFRRDYTHWRTQVPCVQAGVLESLLLYSDLYVYLRMHRDEAPDMMRLSTLWSGDEPLIQEGRLPHETSLPYRRNIRSIAADARAGGSVVALLTMPINPSFASEEWSYGVREHNQHLRELAAENGYLLIDGYGAFEARPELLPEFLDMVHLTSAGNQAKADLAADVLLERWVPTLAAEGARPPVDRADEKPPKARRASGK